jgi:hypothetical protein
MISLLVQLGRMVMTNNGGKLWFAEPTAVDDSFARDDETTFDWISRATSEKGILSRRFLNENLGKVPATWQSKLYNDFRTRDWHTVFFELIVGRTLQILGAAIEVEQPVAGTTRRPDFLAEFPDATITVEATVPELNRVVAKRMDCNEELVKIIESLTPAGWSVQVWHVPELGSNDSKQQFKRTIIETFSQIPAASPGSMPLDITHNYGELDLTLWPGRSGERVAGIRAVAAGPDDTEERIRVAVINKKKQVKKSDSPVVLAISVSPFGRLDDFDQALFGSTFESVDHRGRTISTGFTPTGIFGTSRPNAPTIDAVLAYQRVGFTEVADPVLYLHPRSSAKLSAALMNLQTRSVNANGVQVKPPAVNDVLSDMNFVVLSKSISNQL